MLLETHDHKIMVLLLAFVSFDLILLYADERP